MSEHFVLTCLAEEPMQEAVAKAVALCQWPEHAPETSMAAGGIEEALTLFAGEPSSGILVVSAVGTAEPLDAVRKLAAGAPATSIVVLGGVNDVDAARDMLAAGAADYIVWPASPEKLAAALQRVAKAKVAAVAAAAASAPAREAPRARVVAMMGARGGVGTTAATLACASILSKEIGATVALVDLDLRFGSAALNLNFELGRGLREGLAEPARVDPLFIASARAGADDKLRVFAAEEAVLEDMPDGPEGAMHILTVLSGLVDVILVELPRGLGPAGREVLRAADAVAIVSDRSVVGMRDAMRLTRAIGILRHDRRPVVVAQQVGAPHRGDVGRKTFGEALDGASVIEIPYDAKASRAACEAGRSLPDAAPKSAATRALRALAKTLLGEPKKDAAAPRQDGKAAKSGFWSRSKARA